MQLASSCEVCSSSESFHSQDNSGLCSSITSCIKYTPRRKHYILLHLLRKSFPSSMENTRNIGQPTFLQEENESFTSADFKNHKTWSFPGRMEIPPSPLLPFSALNPSPPDNSLRQDCTSAWETRATFTTCCTKIEKRLLTQVTRVKDKTNTKRQLVMYHFQPVTQLCSNSKFRKSGYFVSRLMPFQGTWTQTLNRSMNISCNSHENYSLGLDT